MLLTEMFNCKNTWKSGLTFLKKLNKNLPLDPDILLLDFYLREMKENVHTKIFLQI